MSTNITMGNDELILFIRKNHKDCATSNDVLGKKIWEWIEKNDETPEQVDGGKSFPCYWANTGTHIGETMLPKTAAQFKFESKLLPELYAYLDDLGRSV